MRQIRRDNPRDALPALQLARALETNRIYLLSRLDAGLVEDLEMIPIAGPGGNRTAGPAKQFMLGFGQCRACHGPRGKRVMRVS